MEDQTQLIKKHGCSKLKFDVVKEALRTVDPNQLKSECLGYETLSDILGNDGYYNFNYEKLNKLLDNSVVGYIVWESICTDTRVGHYVYEFDGKLAFSTYQYYRKDGTDVVVHDAEVFKAFTDELISCINENDRYSIKEFELNKVLWVMDYPNSAIRTLLFLDDDNIMRIIMNCEYNRYMVSYDADLKVEYVGADGTFQTYTGSLCNRIVDCIFDDHEALNTFANQHVSKFLADGILTDQIGHAVCRFDGEKRL